jgi:predicted outer membrane repeat protein
VTNAVFDANRAAQGGGAISNNGGTLTVKPSAFTDNSTTGSGVDTI